ncbi:MAG: PAS domain S-box protein [Candidatus Omnitrophica bacterium]|nr:PAS domain S-box protein [Candidatus Omnitrophota bacterium]
MEPKERPDEGMAKELKELRQIVQQSNSIILKMDTKGNITFFNDFAQRFFGFYKDEIIGKNVLGTIVPKTDRAGKDLESMLKDLEENPERYSVNENENMRHNGELVRIVWSNRPIINDEGQISEIICIGNDITRLKK